MGKIMKKFLATFLMIMMVVAMIPTSCILGFAETINGDSSNNQGSLGSQEEVSGEQLDGESTEEEQGYAIEKQKTEEESDVETLATSTETYKKVSSVINGKKYVIVYDNQYVLKWDGNSYSAVDLGDTNSKDTITIANEDQSNLLWTINSDNIKNDSKNKTLQVNSANKSLTINQLDGNYNLSRNNNQIRSKKIIKSKYIYYLTYNNGWKVNTNSNEKITFYEKYTPSVDLSKPDTYLPESTGGSEKPQWPNQGSVRLDKSATDANFEETGLTRVELSVTGVPVKRGTDVVVVIDNSSSMGQDTSTSKLGQAKQAAKDFVNTILAPNADGTASNNRVSVVSFAQDAKMISNLKNVSNINNVLNAIDDIPASRGTNYDDGTNMAYQILNTAKSVEGYNRNQVVLFMSDGAPYRYYNKQSVHGFANTNVNNIPMHTISTNIKNSLPAKLYTVGFAINVNSKAEVVLRDKMATEGCYRNAKEGDLSSVFNEIANEIKYAGINAVLTDTVGDDFELVMEPKNGFDTQVKIQEYELDADGNRIGNPKDIEIVTFTNSTSAKSSALGDTNIISDGKINASKFTYDITNKTFEWKIGTITSKEIVLSFAEYLTGSMEGNKSAGIYDTNKGKAEVTYTDYRDKEASRDKESPQLPWKSTSINVKYYLVNENGEPVNSAGTKVNFKNRIQIGNTEVISINKGADKTIKASQYLPNGYELLNGNAYYTVNNIGTAGASIKSSYNNTEDKESTIVEGETPYTTSTVNFGVIVHSNLVPDSIVLDYGKPVTFNVLKNDGLVDTKLTGVNDSVKDGITLNTEAVSNRDQNFGDSQDSKFATLVKSGKNGDVTYTLSKYLDEIDKFYYEVEGETTNVDDKGQESTSKFYKYSSISVIPATSVYYEDNFSNGTKNEDGSTNGIIFSGTHNEVKDDNYSTEGKEEQENSQDSNTSYGNDKSYDNDSGFSYGSAHKLTSEAGKSAKAEFTFKGTGFDIIGRTDNATGWIRVKVYDESNNLVKSVGNNTVYQTKGGVLYQIPVLSVKLPEYGNYRAVITVSNTIVAGVSTPNTVYIDAIRIYNPIDPKGADAVEANSQYKLDGEANAIVKEIRNLLLDKADLDGSKYINGAVYVDGVNSKGNNTAVATYEGIGPNNEVYLKPGDSIAFKLKTETPAAIKLGVKAPNGATKVQIGSGSDKDIIIPLSTATDMYYEVKESINFDENGEGYIVITNIDKDSDNIVSLTNLKITYENTPQNQPSILSNSEVGQYAIKTTLSRFTLEDSDIEEDNNKDENDDNNNEDNNDKPEEKPSNTKENVINKVANTIKNIFSKWFK